MSSSSSEEETSQVSKKETSSKNPYPKESQSALNSLQSFKHLNTGNYDDSGDEDEQASARTSVRILEECSITDQDLN